MADNIPESDVGGEESPNPIAESIKRLASKNQVADSITKLAQAQPPSSAPQDKITLAPLVPPASQEFDADAAVAAAMKQSAGFDADVGVAAVVGGGGSPHGHMEWSESTTTSEPADALMRQQGAEIADQDQQTALDQMPAGTQAFLRGGTIEQSVTPEERAANLVAFKAQQQEPMDDATWQRFKTVSLLHPGLDPSFVQQNLDALSKGDEKQQVVGLLQAHPDLVGFYNDPKNVQAVKAAGADLRGISWLLGHNWDISGYILGPVGEFSRKVMIDPVLTQEPLCLGSFGRMVEVAEAPTPPELAAGMPLGGSTQAAIDRQRSLFQALSVPPTEDDLRNDELANPGMTREQLLANRSQMRQDVWDSMMAMQQNVSVPPAWNEKANDEILRMRGQSLWKKDRDAALDGKELSPEDSATRARIEEMSAPPDKDYGNDSALTKLLIDAVGAAPFLVATTAIGGATRPIQQTIASKIPGFWGRALSTAPERAAQAYLVYETSAGDAFKSALDRRDANGNPVFTRAEAARASRNVTAIMSMATSGLLHTFGGGIAKGLTGLLGGVTESLLQRPEVMTLPLAAWKLTKSTASGVGTIGLMDFINNIGLDIAASQKTGEPIDWWGRVKGAIHAGADFAMLAATLGGVGLAGELRESLGQHANDRAHSAYINAVADEIAKNPLFVKPTGEKMWANREPKPGWVPVPEVSAAAAEAAWGKEPSEQQAPLQPPPGREAAKSLVGALMQDQVYLNKAGLEQVAQQQKRTPAELVKMITGSGDAYSEAVNTKSNDVVVPVADYYANTGGTPLGALLQDHLHLDPERATNAQLRAAEVERQATVKKHMATAVEDMPPDQRAVYEDFYQKQLKVTLDALKGKRAKAGGVGMLDAKGAEEYAEQLARGQSAFFKAEADGLTKQHPDQPVLADALYRELTGTGVNFFGADPAVVGDTSTMKRAADFAAEEGVAPATKELRKQPITPESFYVDDETGAKNESAYRRREQPADKKMIGIVEPEGLKWVNDESGNHGQGNGLLRMTAKALHDAGADVYADGPRFKFDTNPEHFADVMKKAKKSLPDKRFELRGAFGKTIEEAVANLDEESMARRATEGGTKTPSGAEPTLAARGERPLGMPKDVKAKDIEFPAAKIEKTPIAQNLKAALKAMPEHEAFNEQNTERATGLLNHNGAKRSPSKSNVAHWDLDGLRSYNTNGDKTLGNYALEAFGTIMRDAAPQGGGVKGHDVDAAHLSGDEYETKHNDLAMLRQHVDDVRKEAQNFVGFHKLSDDRYAVLDGLGVSVGTGGDHESAEAALRADKDARAAQGERGDIANSKRVRIFTNKGDAFRFYQKLRGERPGVPSNDEGRGGVPAGQADRNVAEGQRVLPPGEGRRPASWRGLSQGLPNPERRVAAGRTDLGNGWQTLEQPGARAGDPKNLVVLHNLTAGNLRHADELGGLPAPSLGISRVEHPMTAYGEISLIADPKMVDPRTGTPVFESDAYSPRWPDSEFNVKQKEADALRAMLKPSAQATHGYLGDLEGELGRKGADIVHDRNFKDMLGHAFLTEKGKAPKEKMKTHDVGAPLDAAPGLMKFLKDEPDRRTFDHGDDFHVQASDAFKKDMEALRERLNKEDPKDPHQGDDIADDLLKEHLGDDGLLKKHLLTRAIIKAPTAGTTEPDTYAMADAVRDALKKKSVAKEFDAWAKEKIAPTLGDRFIEKYNERTDTTREIPYNLQSVLREMTEKIRQGENFNYGWGTARAAGAHRFESLAGIEAARSKIVSREEFTKLKDAMDNRGAALASELERYHSGDEWHALDHLAEAVGESYKPGHLLADELEQSSYKNVPSKLREKVEKYAQDLLAMPTEYFESKPQRAVDLSEFKAAVVPKDADKATLDILRKHGIGQIVKYDSKDDGHGSADRARQQAVQQAAGRVNVLFQPGEAPGSAFALERPTGETSRLEQPAFHGSPIAPPFYSQAEHAVRDAKQEKGTAASWLAIVSKAPGVKAEEIDTLGLKDWLAQQKGTVTKQAVRDYINANRLDVREKELGESNTAPDIGEAGESPLFQRHAKAPGGARGYITFDPGGGKQPRRFDIHMLDGADKSTLAHETFHFLSEVFGDIAQRPDASPEQKADYLALIRYMGFDSHEDRLALARERVELDSIVGRTPAQTERRNELVAKEERGSHAWEQYLCEGKAPTPELVPAFARFHLWLTAIYRKLIGGTPADQYKATFGKELGLTDDVRGVFARMLGADDAVNGAMNDVEHRPIPAVLAAMTPERRDEYEKDLQTRKDAATTTVRRYMAEASAAENRGLAKAEKDRLRAEVEPDISNQPIYQTIDKLTGGLDGAGWGPKLDPATVHAMGGDLDKMLARQHKGVFGDSADNRPTVPVTDMAQMLGYKSPEDLVRQLLNAAPKEQAIRDEVERRFKDIYGPTIADPEGRQQLADLAMNVVHDEHHVAAVHRELYELEGMLGIDRLPPRAHAEETNKTAARILEGKTVGEVRLDAFLRNERTAATAAFKAAEKGDIQEARAQKAAQALDAALYRQARDMSRSLASQEKYVNRAAGDDWRAFLAKAPFHAPDGSLDMTLRDANDAVLSAVNLGPGEPQNAVGASAAIDAFVRSVSGNGADDANISPSGVEQITWDVDAVKRLLAAPKDWKGLSTADAANIHEALKNIRAHATNERGYLMADRRIDRDVFNARVKQDSDKVRAAKAPYGRTEVENTAFTSRLKDMAGAVKAALIGIERTADQLVGGDHSNPLYELLVTRQWDCRHAKSEAILGVEPKIRALWDALPKAVRDRANEMLDVTPFGMTVPERARGTLGNSGRVSRGDLWQIALNMGNVEGRQRIQAGWGWDPAQVERAMGRYLSKGELDYVQGIHNILESYWPKIAALHERTTGLALGKVQAVPYDVRDKDGNPIAHMDGGYFPLVRNWRVEEKIREQTEDVSKAFSPNYVPAATAQGHTIKRVQNASYLIDFNHATTINSLAQVVHDLAYREWAQTAWRVMSDPAIHDIIKQRPDMGPKFIAPMKQWIKEVANGQAESAAAGTQVFHSASGMVRNAMAMHALGWSLALPVADMVRPGLAVATKDIPLWDLTKTLAKMIASPPGTYSRMRQFALANSVEMKDYDADAQRHILRLSQEMGPHAPGAARRLLRAVNDTAYCTLEFSTRVNSTLIWTAKYDSLVGTLGPEAAAREANIALSRWVPSHEVTDQPAIMRDKRGIGQMLFMYGFWSKAFQGANALRQEAMNILHSPEAGFGTKAGTVARNIGGMMALAGLLGASKALLGERHQKDKETGEEESDASYYSRLSLLSLPESVPIVGPIVDAVAANMLWPGEAHQHINVQQMPVLSGLQTAADHAYALSQITGDKSDAAEKAIDALIDSLGFVAVPAARQPQKTARYLYGQATGNAPPPEGVLPVIGGVLHGPPRQEGR